MTNSQDRKLIQMVNQIADNVKFEGLDESEAADRVAIHLRKFWARSMKTAIIDYQKRDGADLNPVARLAVARLSL